MAKSELLDKLTKLSTSHSSFEDSYDESAVTPIIDVEEYIETSKKKEKKKETLSSRTRAILDHAKELTANLDDELADEIDDYLESKFFDDEDSDLRRSLVSMGRKYARDTAITGETSVVARAFSGAEKRLDQLLTEVRSDKESLQKDISTMRAMRTRNFKVLSELIETKGQFHATELSVIKEMNATTKAQFDIQSKIKERNEESDNADAAASKAMQQLFGMGRSELISSVGGYSAMSGAGDNDNDDIETYMSTPSDEFIHKKLFNDVEETDGDKFLRYENDGVEYILLVDKDNGDTTVIAEDKNGNIVPDYPMPSNIEELSFDIDESTLSATDDLHRSYKVRYT